MIKHILKLIWNRKRANTLVALEIAVSFIVLFAVVAIGVYSFGNLRRPLGFDYANVWNVSIDHNSDSGDRPSPEMWASTRRLILAAHELPEVESVAAVAVAPYSTNRDISNTLINGLSVHYDLNEVTDEYKDVMRLTLVSGRWFSREDDAAKDLPVVINERLANRIFGAEGAVGKLLSEASEDRRAERIIGVITDFRSQGEYSGPGNYAFFRASLDSTRGRPPANLALRLRPGTTRAFEERLARSLQAEAKDDSFQVTPITEMRETNLAIHRAPLIAVSLVALFLMLMVALGLTGVLWQNVTQRTREIGLRRAKGATETDIHVQILGELFVITSLGLMVGAIVAIQFPLLVPLDSVGSGVYIWSFAISLLAMYALTMLCGLYPSRLASRVRPAEALHYD